MPLGRFNPALAFVPYNPTHFGDPLMRGFALFFCLYTAALLVVAHWCVTVVNAAAHFGK